MLMFHTTSMYVILADFHRPGTCFHRGVNRSGTALPTHSFIFNLLDSQGIDCSCFTHRPSITALYFCKLENVLQTSIISGCFTIFCDASNDCPPRFPIELGLSGSLGNKLGEKAT
jgi:hypothetical protein